MIGPLLRRSAVYEFTGSLPTKDITGSRNFHRGAPLECKCCLPVSLSLSSCHRVSRFARDPFATVPVRRMTGRGGAGTVRARPPAAPPRPPPHALLRSRLHSTEPSCRGGGGREPKPSRGTQRWTDRRTGFLPQFSGSIDGPIFRGAS